MLSGLSLQITGTRCRHYRDCLAKPLRAAFHNKSLAHYHICHGAAFVCPHNYGPQCSGRGWRYVVISYSKNFSASVASVLGDRPLRSNRGKGGASAQLAAFGELIRPDLHKATGKRPRTTNIPTNVPLNAMAPPAKQCRGVSCSLLFLLFADVKFSR